MPGFSMNAWPAARGWKANDKNRFLSAKCRQSLGINAWAAAQK
jgi:hypothetical protein